VPLQRAPAAGDGRRGLTDQPARHQVRGTGGRAPRGTDQSDLSFSWVSSCLRNGAPKSAPQQVAPPLRCSRTASGPVNEPGDGITSGPPFPLNVILAFPA